MKQPPVLSLIELRLDRLPGIDAPFGLTTRPGVNLISGPNEAGKSSLARAVFQLLWPDDTVVPPFSVRGTFSDASGSLQARRDDTEPVLWTRAGEPTPAPALPGGHLARCYRLGLLDLNQGNGGDLDRDLAREIRKQMAGGFDLARVAELFPDHGGRLSRRRTEWYKTRQKLQKCQLAQHQLATEEQGLAELEVALDRARLAARRADQLTAALEYVGLARQGRELTSRLADLPPHMEQVREGDDETLATLVTELQTLATRLNELRGAKERRAAKISELAVDGDLEELSQTIQLLRVQTTRADETQRTLAAALATAETARADLPPELLAAEVPAAARQAFTRLARAHREWTAHEVAVTDLKLLLDHPSWQENETPDSGEAPAEALALLTSPHLGAPDRTPLLVGLAGLAAAAALFAWRRDWPVAVAPAVLGVAGLVQWWRTRAAGLKARRRLEELGRSHDQPLPVGWTPPDVLQSYLAQARLSGEQAGDRQTRRALRKQLERLLSKAEARLDQATADLTALRREFNQDADHDLPELLHEFDRLARCRTAESELIAARGAHDQVESRRAELQREARRQLGELGVTTSDSLAAILAGLENLRTRNSEAVGLREAQSADEAALRRVEADLAAARDRRDHLRKRLDLPAAVDDATLVDLVNARTAALTVYEKLSRELATAQRDQEQLQERLDGPADRTEVLALPTDEIERRLQTETKLAAEADQLLQKIERVRTRVSLAREHDELETALAHETTARDNLSDLLADQRDTVLGRLLVSRVARRHEDNTQPPLLTAMNKHLARFTGGRYRLRVTGQEPARFVAVDNSDRRLELSALSDGTRAQLLLAARLAFLTGAEHDLQAPLFLDEALTASDPARFDAIAGAVGEMAATTGRQVFYLSSNPADTAAWQRALGKRRLPPAHEVDLAVQRKLGAAASATVLAAPAIPDIPAPAGHDAAAYGALLKVPALQPWADENTVHLFHLWRDDLDLLHRLLVGGTPTLGQWRQLGRNLVEAGSVQAAEAARIDARGQVYGAFLDLWRVGRGKPVTREDLVRSEALSEKMLPPACDLLAKSGGNADTFMAAVKDGGIARLNQAKKETLQAYLERQGHLDPGKILQPDQVVARVLGIVAADGGLTPAVVRRLVLHLHAVAAES